MAFSGRRSDHLVGRVDRGGHKSVALAFSLGVQRNLIINRTARWSPSDEEILHSRLLGPFGYIHTRRPCDPWTPTLLILELNSTIHNVSLNATNFWYLTLASELGWFSVSAIYRNCRGWTDVTTLHAMFTHWNQLRKVNEWLYFNDGWLCVRGVLFQYMYRSSGQHVTSCVYEAQ